MTRLSSADDSATESPFLVSSFGHHHYQNLIHQRLIVIVDVDLLVIVRFGVLDVLLDPCVVTEIENTEREFRRPVLEFPERLGRRTVELLTDPRDYPFPRRFAISIEGTVETYEPFFRSASVL